MLPPAKGGPAPPPVPLPPGPLALLQKVQAFKAPNYRNDAVSVWHRLPVSRRAAVLVVLFAGRFGELRVILTKRLSRLRNFPGHISLPGGKADQGLELPWMVARRESLEEIGLASDADLAAQGVTLWPLAELPCYLSRTFLAVRPCVAFLDAGPDAGLLLQLNPGESSGIFSCPLQDFLYPREGAAMESIDRLLYKVRWGGIPWNLRLYTFPQENLHEVLWLQGLDDLTESEESHDEDSASEEPNSEKPRELGSSESSVVPPAKDSVPRPPEVKTLEAIQATKDFVFKDFKNTQKQTPTESSSDKKSRISEWVRRGARRDLATDVKIYDVWGLTANILHDLAEVVYLGQVPEKQYGEEELIGSFWESGQMRQHKRLAAESALIASSPTDSVSFGDVISRSTFLRLKRIYKI